jgi:metal-responsive CopG/Arc/MetJ family transcriptional regulator
MMSCMRTVIDVPDEVIRSLDKVGDIENRSRAELIREAIAEYLKRKAVAPAEAAFGLWQQKAKDGVQFQRELRDEWVSR